MNKQQIKFQLAKLKDLLSHPTTDVSWSSYNSPSDVIKDLNLIEEGILNDDRTFVDKLLYLLSPTSDLQEISINSGWENEFIEIAESLESAV